jgi:hypothetical protein
MKSRVQRSVITLLIVALVAIGIVFGVRALGGLGIHEFFQKMHGG